MDQSDPWRSKFVKSLELNYRRASCFNNAMYVIRPLIEDPESNIADFNVACILNIADKMALRCRFVRQTQLSDPAVFEKRASTRLAAACRELGATAYLAGDGAANYEDQSVYAKANTRLFFNDSKGFPYNQSGAKEFVPGLSILDAFLNIGHEETARLLLQNEQ